MATVIFTALSTFTSISQSIKGGHTPGGGASPRLPYSVTPGMQGSTEVIVLDIDSSRRVTQESEQSGKKIASQVPYGQLRPYLKRLNDSRFVSLVFGPHQSFLYDITLLPCTSMMW
ncbi:hypothetical protein E2C01_092543 [Portunus trituberculatus]|uniref:Uncharacterized protein n=1 Tax=Portunus trituberculatus TaxID=210409 RepID=A0A5B7JQU5_PORTR|nr:hypothetical protein [Portunus trituberculatus]